MSELNMSELNLASPFHSSLTNSISNPIGNPVGAPKPTFLDTILKPVRNWLDNLEVVDRDTAHLICKLIPAQCPFERDIVILGHKLAHIPPMCKINPLYDQLVGLRFRSLCYLVDVCGETL